MKQQHITQSMVRQGRRCDTNTLLRQVGLMNVLSISGGRREVIYDETDNEPIGVLFPCGTNRYVHVVLSVWDLYDVRRYRRITRGANRGAFVLEYEQTEVYCDELGEVAYRASLWDSSNEDN